MKNTNKIIAFLFLSLVSSLFFSKQILAEELDIAPFSDEIIKEESVIVNDVKIIDTKTEQNKSENKIYPKITYPKQNGFIDGAQIIYGEISSGYNVKVYIDGNYRVTLNVWPSKTGVSGFFYEPVQKLKLGKHSVKFIATKNNIDYGSSNEVFFEVIEGYNTPKLLEPYYYADDPSTYVIRGYANSGDKMEIYLNDKKVRTIEKISGNTKDVYFAFALNGLKEGVHKAYVVTYNKNTGLQNPKSKLVYFDVKLNSSEIKNSEIIKSEKDDLKNKEENTKEDIKKENTKKEINNKIESKESIKDKKVEKDTKTEKVEKDNSIIIGIILLVAAIGLIIFWLISENKEKVKKFIDNLFEEDDDSNK